MPPVWQFIAEHAIAIGPTIPSHMHLNPVADCPNPAHHICLYLKGSVFPLTIRPSEPQHQPCFIKKVLHFFVDEICAVHSFWPG
jgi:hypothetical protein